MKDKERILIVQSLMIKSIWQTVADKKVDLINLARIHSKCYNYSGNFKNISTTFVVQSFQKFINIPTLSRCWLWFPQKHFVYDANKPRKRSHVKPFYDAVSAACTCSCFMTFSISKPCIEINSLEIAFLHEVTASTYISFCWNNPVLLGIYGL